MTRWLISVPVYGERYVDEFCSTALPSIQRAVKTLMNQPLLDSWPYEKMFDVRLVIHTDQPDRVRGATDLACEFRPVPAGARTLDSMSQGHREALALGMNGDVVVLLNAGSVISEAGLLYCADVFENNPRLKVVLCAAPRVLSEGRIPDTGDAQAFMSWAWGHRHPMTRECTWPDGRSVDLSRTFNINSDGVVTTQQILPHPLAVKIDGRVLRFTPTIDANLMLCFDPIEMHMATDCQALALIKLTPADKGYELSDKPMSARVISVTVPHQQWCMEHRIVLCPAPN